MFWQSTRIHHATSLSRVRMVVTFSGSFRIEFSSNSFGLDRSIKWKMGVIGKNRHREQVNSKVCSLRFQLLCNPNLAVVEVLSRDGIEPKKKAATCHPTDDVQDLHRPLDQLPLLLLAEDLNVAVPITYWVIDAFMPPKPWAKNPQGPIPDTLIEVDVCDSLTLHPGGSMWLASHCYQCNTRKTI